MRQTQQTTDAGPQAFDTSISGLTYAYGSTTRELENLVTREFHADPNLHKNSNVELVGDYSTSGTPSVSFEWTWKWKAPRTSEDKGGGWRNSCSVRICATSQLIFANPGRILVRRIRLPRPQPESARELLLLCGCSHNNPQSPQFTNDLRTRLAAQDPCRISPVSRLPPHRRRDGRARVTTHRCTRT